MSLLQELLNAVSEENLVTPAGLARRLEVNQELVALMLADLEKAGYLQAITARCGSCTGCGQRQACRPPQARYWIRTGKPS